MVADLRKVPWAWILLLLVVAGVLWGYSQGPDRVEDRTTSLASTGCVQVRDTALHIMVRERLTRMALETRVVAMAPVCTPDADLVARVEELEAAVQLACADLCTAYGDATPLPSSSPGPTETLEFLPTVTRSPTPNPWCHACGPSDRGFVMPAGYFCKECRSGVWRAVPLASPADCLKCVSTPSARTMERGGW